MRTLFFSSITTLTILLVDKYRKEAFSPFKYVFLFFIFLITSFFFVEGSEPDIPYQFKTEYHIELFKVENHDFFYEEMLSDAQLKIVHRKIQFHKDEGWKYFNKAKSIIPIFPALSRQRLREYFANAMEASTWPGSLWSRVTAALIASLFNYGLDVYGAFDQLVENLNEAKHHFEMKEFFENMLNNG